VGGVVIPPDEAGTAGAVQVDVLPGVAAVAVNTFRHT
jgi:hypothetical protein